MENIKVYKIIIINSKRDHQAAKQLVDLFSWSFVPIIIQSNPTLFIDFKT